ncbi:hypothetical protein M9Y10_009879 [Tritrichomonas musculus]|uniref:Serine/threonine-protein kinase PLK n=1 Tax=Tritrichomonas musculus TaxID=1915356 RepID=A0ABR2IR13_9EUKA
MLRVISVPLVIPRKRELGSTVNYQRHEELGRGGFAAVYRVTNQSTGEEFALKVVPKERVQKPKSLEKLKNEMALQRSLNHPNILKSYDNFEDSKNYYILLELAPNGSVKDMVKKNRYLSEYETARILREVMSGLCYLHDNRIIHRDLKLENFLIGKDNKVKIADFGLSTKLDYDDERKYTVCGTPNYLSPELLTNSSKGHSYEVDIWTIGVCAFAMLTGRPPFETSKRKLTYEHIKNCKYQFPSEIPLSAAARDFIKGILQIKPERRPNAQDVALHPFLTQLPPKVKKVSTPSTKPTTTHDIKQTYELKKLGQNREIKKYNDINKSPTSETKKAPITRYNNIRENFKETPQRSKPENGANADININININTPERNDQLKSPKERNQSTKSPYQNNTNNSNNANVNDTKSDTNKSDNNNINANNINNNNINNDINTNLNNNNNNNKNVREHQNDEDQLNEKSTNDKMVTMPKNFVSRFCDHSDKYGLGYMLIDGTIGACFNDWSRMVMDPFETFVQYWESYQTVSPEIMDPVSGPQTKKLALIRRFAESLKKTKTMFELPAKKFNQNSPMKHVKYWMRNDDATLFRMDDRNIQVNFNDRIKLIIFWNSKKMMMVHSIREAGKLVALTHVNSQQANSEERKRYNVARSMLAAMSTR